VIAARLDLYRPREMYFDAHGLFRTEKPTIRRAAMTTPQQPVEPVEPVTPDDRRKNDLQHEDAPDGEQTKR